MSPLVPDSSLPRLWCDFNACGWSGVSGDNCFYVFDKNAFQALPPAEGMRVVLYDDDGDGNVIGCVGRLEPYDGSWRIRPEADSWFRGRTGELGI